MELQYTFTQRRPAPFLGLRSEHSLEQQRRANVAPATLRAKGGVSTAIGPDAGVSIGLAVERDLVKASNVAGLEVAPGYRTRLRPGNVLSSEVKFFWGASASSTLSLKNYNSLHVRLVGNLAATFDANLFLHQDSQVGELAVKSELHIGLGYSWNRKWF